MSIYFDCQHYCGDEDSMKCGVMGYIMGCPAECEDYINYFGKKPFAKETEIEKRLRGEV